MRIKRSSSVAGVVPAVKAEDVAVQVTEIADVAMEEVAKEEPPAPASDPPPKVEEPTPQAARIELSEDVKTPLAEELDVLSAAERESADAKAMELDELDEKETELDELDELDEKEPAHGALEEPKVPDYDLAGAANAPIPEEDDLESLSEESPRNGAMEMEDNADEVIVISSDADDIADAGPSRRADPDSDVEIIEVDERPGSSSRSRNRDSAPLDFDLPSDHDSAFEPTDESDVENLTPRPSPMGKAKGKSTPKATKSTPQRTPKTKGKGKSTAKARADSDSDIEILDVAPRRGPSKTDRKVPGMVRCPAREPATLQPLFLAPVECSVENSWVCLFFRFCVERHKMYEIRRDALAAGRTVSRNELTEDECMKSLHIGNVFRQLDPSSQFMRDVVIEVGDQSHTEVCFRVFLYCHFYNAETWKLLSSVATGGLPTWKHFEEDIPAMEAVLYRRSVVEGEKIYYGGFQLVPPTIYFTDDRNKSKSMANFAASLRLVLAAMRAGLPDQLKACKYAVDASYVLQTIPTLGGFLSLNILCYLNDTTNFKWVYRDFATCGPGSRYLMQRMFGKQTINSVAMEEAGLKWLTDHQWKYYARLGLDPPHEYETGLRPGMRALDVENALCWCHRYINAFQTKDVRSLHDLGLPTYATAAETHTGPPAWVVESRWRHSSSRAVWDAEHDEAADRVYALDDAEEVYEVEKVITRLGSRATKKKDPVFRVRWTGWTPEEDTWEPASTIRDGAAEVLDDWTDWEDRVWGAIEGIKRDMPYKWPARDREQREEDEGGRATRAAKRVKRESE